ncbi:MAG: hypothetical protein IJT46_08470 [Bacteroidaceae bacterium]|nr:hypothetical protein [Bacteroidaceae bacterium]
MTLLLVRAAALPDLFDSTLTQYQLCLNFFKLEDVGHVLVRAVKDKGDLRIKTMNTKQIIRNFF